MSLFRGVLKNISLIKGTSSLIKPLVRPKTYDALFFVNDFYPVIWFEISLCLHIQLKGSLTLKVL